MGIAARCVHGAGLCVIPRPDNDYRPWILRHRPLAFVSALLIVTKILTVGVLALTPVSAELSTITVNRIVQLTNAEREKVGLNSLTVNSKLGSAAQDKAAHMLAEDYFAHISPSGVTPWFWISKYGYTYQIAGENLAIDFTEAEDVVAAWIASSSHRENMLLPDYVETGVAVATGEFQGGTSTVVVHMFGRPTGYSAPVPTPSVAAKTTPTATPTPTPTPTVTPTPTIIPTPPPDTSPPGSPRIALVGGSEVQEEVVLKIAGEAGADVQLLVNSQPRGQITLGANGEARVDLDVSDFPDGTLIIRGYAIDATGNESGLSESLALLKDTEAPRLAQEQVALTLSPNTDAPIFLLTVTDVEAETIELTQNEEVRTYVAGDQIVVLLTASRTQLAVLDGVGNTSASYELTLQPQFAGAGNQDFLQPPSRFSRATRTLAAVIFMILLLLLTVAVLIHVRIQRPALISHAALVLLLAVIFLFV